MYLSLDVTGSCMIYVMDIIFSMEVEKRLWRRFLDKITYEIPLFMRILQI